MFNKVYLIGNLGRDPMTGTTGGGLPFANLSIATDRRWRNGDGKPHEKTDWHNVVCFGRLAEIAAQYLARGRQIFVVGRLQTRCFKDEESGEERYRSEVLCEDFQMLGPAPGSLVGAPAPAKPHRAEPVPKAADAGGG